ncbi:right-handed parallel beta-helix repeat-containing protein [Dyadobacter fermentans]|uniref:Secretion system C-terminal sorting domain-containing protein n=1 Tax=Dyadobacter fermentans (strain ATCC 700827 / DSM 18053 / CIP 107007 / KCTC 52180 / NS114) TaxID=471854 RepID=C6W2A8_DYAFD|nr:right-handed parallel beta-helix repeat-containing protein [Dyadobacter fermentans]ACT92081.1 hypothetical protein Dfer_0821 [Dyadobacter fermentans DSM 18053]
MHSTIRSSKNEKLFFVFPRTALCRAIFLFLSTFSIIASAQAKIWYVTYSGGATTKDGRSWGTAYNTLQSTIDQSEAGDQIWVAGGTYYPEFSSAGLSLKEGVKVYGGFSGTEANLTDRNLKLTQNKSVITGGRLHSYTINNDHTEADGLTRATLLDGFTVIGGILGGMRNYHSSPTLSNLFFKENGASNSLGAVIIVDSSPLFVNVIITGNQGAAALSNSGSAPVLVNCAIVDNTVEAAVLINSNSAPVLLNCTIATKKTQAKAVGIGNMLNSVPKIRNSIISAVIADIRSHESSSADIRDSQLFTDFTEGPSGLIPTKNDPFFENPASGNYRLQKCSPAVNMGSNIYYASGQNPDISGISTDLDGNTRFFDGGNADLGAYEYQALREPAVTGVLFIKPGGTGSGITWECAAGNPQDAIDRSLAGQQVWVAGGQYLLDKDHPLVMKEGVKIYGGFAGTETSLGERDLSVKVNNSILRGSGQLVVANSDAGITPSAVLDGFTITGGMNGISNSQSSPTLSNLLITGNPLNGAFMAGGIMNYESNAITTNCAIVGNQGSGTVVGIVNMSSSPVITNCTITGNTTTGPGSVGIANLGNSGPKIRNCIIYGNQLGVFSEPSSSPTIEYSLVDPNPPTDPNAPQPPGIDPLFVNAAAGNYRLQPCSPGVNTGFNYFQAGLTPDLSGLNTDLESKPRIREHMTDMGAYEFGGETRELASDLDEASATIDRDKVLTSFDSNCRLVAYLLPNGPAPVKGYVSAKVWVASSQPANFVKRHYQISPGIDTQQATARVTLYFTQQEFTDFNEVNEIKLPLDAADVENHKANLWIEKRPGFSIDGSGLPNSYIGDVVSFKPSEANGKIEWNADARHWEVSFDVTGFSGFFVKTRQSTLPLNLVSFTATKEAGSNVLQWSTASEINTDQFEIQRSSNARTFVGVATVEAAGSGSSQYSYHDRTGHDRTSYYRLKMSDLDGTFSYSKIISLAAHGDGAGIYPNLARASITFQASDALLQTTAHLYDIMGHRVQSITVTSNRQQLDTEQLISGLYILKFADGTVQRFVKE